MQYATCCLNVLSKQYILCDLHELYNNIALISEANFRLKKPCKTIPIQLKVIGTIYLSMRLSNKLD